MLLASAAMAQSPQPQARQPFTQRALDEILAPIALYPDSLLSLTLVPVAVILAGLRAARA